MAHADGLDGRNASRDASSTSNSAYVIIDLERRQWLKSKIAHAPLLDHRPGLLALPILLHSPGALSAEPSKDSASPCGKTPNEAVAAAEKALLDKSADGQARAITCLIAAVKKLEAERLDVVRREGEARVLKVPITK